MYLWGSNDSFQLGLEHSNDVFTPVFSEFPPTSLISDDFLIASSNHSCILRSVSCGRGHSVFVTNNGSLYACGSNIMGQCGLGDPSSRLHQIKVDDDIVHVSCGDNHTLAITTHHRVLSWGSNTYGQLGRSFSKRSSGDNSNMYDQPVYVEGPLTTFPIVQVACGGRHCLALARNGTLFAWGCNLQGQLGLGSTNSQVCLPEPIKSMHGLPLQKISAGGLHNLVVTVSGAVFGWGSNTYGQLGIDSIGGKSNVPTPVRALRSHFITNLSCGDSHSAALSAISGKVFTFGRNNVFQLGHCTNKDCGTPQRPSFLNSSRVSNVVCGRLHTVFTVEVNERTDLFAAGSNDYGQLANNTVIGNTWCRCSHSLSNIGLIVSGGSHCIAIESNICEKMNPNFFEIRRLNLSTAKFLSQLQSDYRLSKDQCLLLTEIFSSPNCLNASFLLPTPQQMYCSNSNSGLDMELLVKTSDALGSSCHGELGRIVFNALESCILPSLNAVPPDYEALRLYIIIPQTHLLFDASYFQSLILPFGEALLALSEIPSRVIVKWWKKMSPHYFSRQLTVFKNAILFIVSKANHQSISEEVRAKALTVFLKVIDKIYQVDQSSGGIVALNKFYLPELLEYLECDKDIVAYFSENKSHFPLINYPFIFNVAAKSKLLREEAELSKTKAVREFMIQYISRRFMGQTVPSNEASERPFFILEVDRNDIVYSAFRAVQGASRLDLKKPLRVKFINEIAVDDGGVRKEFFMLALRELMHPKYGMFKIIDKSQVVWFSNGINAADFGLFFLVGVICGLAIYNETIIDLKFPEVVYKKLLNRNLHLNDLSDIASEILTGLKSLLAYNGDDFTDVFSLTFQVSEDFFGEMKTVDLIYNGGELEVTQVNKQTYVDVYADYLLNKSIEKEFNSFKQGFFTVCNSEVLPIFNASELMQLVAGCPTYDLFELESSTKYKGIYYAGHKTIRFFWDAIHSFDDEHIKKFLHFVTGSERVPVQGLSSLGLVIQPMFVEGECHLPAAHTCYNILDLPVYSTYATLLSKLNIAINHAEGFGLV